MANRPGGRPRRDALNTIVMGVLGLAPAVPEFMLTVGAAIVVFLGEKPQREKGGDLNNISIHDQILGRIAVAENIVSAGCLRDLYKRVREDLSERSLTQWLFLEEIIDQEQLARIVRIQRKKRCQHVKQVSGKLGDEQMLMETLLAESLVTLDDLETGMLEKKRLQRKHLRFHIGEILIHLGLVEKSEVLRILREKRGEIRHCRRCDMNFHVSARVAEQRWACSRCGGALEEVSFLGLIEADGKVM